MWNLKTKQMNKQKTNREQISGCCLVVQSCPTLCNPMDCSTPALPVPHHLLELAQVHVHCISNGVQHLILWHPLFFLLSMFPSIRNFSNESFARIRWPKYWSFHFSINPSSEHSGFISLKIDWFDLLAVQGTLRSLLQHHSSKATMLWHSTFFIVQLSQSCITAGKTIALTIQTFIGRVFSLRFNTPSRFAIALDQWSPEGKWRRVGKLGEGDDVWQLHL